MDLWRFRRLAVIALALAFFCEVLTLSVASDALQAVTAVAGDANNSNGNVPSGNAEVLKGGVRSENDSLQQDKGESDLSDILSLEDNDLPLAERNDLLQKDLRKNAFNRAKLEQEKSALLQRVKELQEHVNKDKSEMIQWKAKEQEADSGLQSALDRKKTLRAENDILGNQTSLAEKELSTVNAELPAVEQSLASLQLEINKFDQQRQELEKQEAQVMEQLKTIMGHFQSDEVLVWLEANTREMSPILRESILRTYRMLPAALDPVRDGIDTAAELDKLLYEHVGLDSTSVLAGTIFYLILLLPAVMAVWVIVKIKSKLVAVTLEHYLLGFAFYFACLCITCLGISLVAREDALLLFHRHFSHMADTIIIGHIVLFFLHFMLQLLYTISRKSVACAIMLVSICAIGKHFFYHGYGRVLLEQDPDVGSEAYASYLILYFIMIIHNRYGPLILQTIRKGRQSSCNGDKNLPELPSFMQEKRNVK